MVEYLIIFLPLNTRYFCWYVGSTWSYPIPWPNILKIIAFITPKSIIISCILCSLCYGASNIMYVMIIWDGSDLNETGIIQVSCKLLRFPPPYHVFILISFFMVHQLKNKVSFLDVYRDIDTNWSRDQIARRILRQSFPGKCLSRL